MNQPVRRGVYSLPWRSDEGALAFAAVAADGRKLLEVYVRAGGSTIEAETWMWERLDQLDPEEQLRPRLQLVGGSR